MKTLKSQLPAFDTEPLDSEKKIRWLVRLGQAHELPFLHSVNEMICPDCGNIHGLVSRHYQDYCWFCSNPSCFLKSAEISKRKVRARKHIYDIDGNLSYNPSCDPKKLGIDINEPDSVPYKKQETSRFDA